MFSRMAQSAAQSTIQGSVPARFHSLLAERRFYCGVYPARPAVCRSFPGAGCCGYYDFLSFERRTQNDPEFVALTDH